MLFSSLFYDGLVKQYANMINSVTSLKYYIKFIILLRFCIACKIHAFSFIYILLSLL